MGCGSGSYVEEVQEGGWDCGFWCHGFWCFVWCWCCFGIWLGSTVVEIARMAIDEVLNFGFGFKGRIIVQVIRRNAGRRQRIVLDGQSVGAQHSIQSILARTISLFSTSNSQ